MPGRRPSPLEELPLSLKVIAALSLTLLPLGAIALTAALRSWAQSSGVSIGATQMLTIAAPILMWLAAVAIASLSLSRFVIEPLREMQGVVERYSAGDLGARMVDGTHRSPELRELSQAFDSMADRMAGHAQAMDAALATQRALTREVHHRVKNNLQIVSSLLSLQARDATTPEAAGAYALIRQRVNALALVHRWMYQDEGAKGVELRPLLSDLSANLEHGFDGRAPGSRRVSCTAARICVGQDTALPIAFLVTELVAGACDAGDGRMADARIEATRLGDTACLKVASAAFEGEDGLTGFEDGTRRIVSGLSRQLRSPLRYDADAHSFTIEFPSLAE